MADPASPAYLIESPDELVAALASDGWRVIGPRLGDGAVVIGEIDSAADMPRGVSDRQTPGRYELVPGTPGSWFEHVVGPHAWKASLFPSRHKLWSAERTADGFEIREHEEDFRKTALIGVRACDLAALGVHDGVFGHKEFSDPGYRRRREESLIVAVQCARSAETCFCASMNTGPRAEAGYDIALTELGDDHGGAMLAECGSARGAAILERIATRPAEAEHLAAARAISARAAAMQTRHMPAGIAATLRSALDHPRWDDVAERCLSCANCTMACPTCFCSDVEDVNDLKGDHAERWRVWDSCFTAEFSYIHGGSVRRSTRSRYRQWMTHKLSSWHDQFGTSGCVGCGRCITMCPVGIDIVEEANAMTAVPEAAET